MAFTWPSALFFLSLVGLLTGMTLWQLKSPSQERQGLLRITTTRGDRLFIGLLTSAFLHIFWLMWSSAPLLIISFFCLIFIILLIRYG